MDHNELHDIAQNSVFFIQNGDVFRIDYTQDDGFHCHDELTGAEHFVEFGIVDPKQDFFYRLERVNLVN